MSDNLTFKLGELLLDGNFNRASNLDELIKLIKNGADVDGNLGDVHLTTFLCYAVRQGDYTLAKLLLEAGANPDLKCGEGMSPLHYAALMRSAAIAQILLENGADISVIDNEKNTPLMFIDRELNRGLASSGFELIMKAIRASFRAAECKMDEKVAPLNDKIKLGVVSEAEIVKYLDILLEEGYNINLKDSKSNTAINYAVEQNYCELTAKLIDLGAEVKGVRDQIFNAVRHTKNPKMIKLLIEKSRNTMITDEYRLFLLNIADAVDYRDEVHKQDVVDAIKNTKSINLQIIAFKERKSKIKFRCQNKKIAGGMKI